MKWKTPRRRWRICWEGRSGIRVSFGEWDARVRQAAIDAGYEYAVSTIRGVVTPSMDKFTIPRVNIRWNNCGYLFDRKIRSAYRAVDGG